MTRPFRSQLVLMAISSYSFGQHVTDPQAFVRRVPRAIELWLRCCDECEQWRSDQ